MQSKTTNLTDTVHTIATKLKDERKRVQEELKSVQELKNISLLRRRGNPEGEQKRLQEWNGKCWS